jgi:hypothetical protein
MLLHPILVILAIVIIGLSSVLLGETVRLRSTLPPATDNAMMKHTALWVAEHASSFAPTVAPFRVSAETSMHEPSFVFSMERIKMRPVAEHPRWSSLEVVIEDTRSAFSYERQMKERHTQPSATAKTTGGTLLSVGGCIGVGDYGLVADHGRMRVRVARTGQLELVTNLETLPAVVMGRWPAKPLYTSDTWRACLQHDGNLCLTSTSGATRNAHCWSDVVVANIEPVFEVANATPSIGLVLRADKSLCLELGKGASSYCRSALWTPDSITPAARMHNLHDDALKFCSLIGLGLLTYGAIMILVIPEQKQPRQPPSIAPPAPSLLLTPTLCEDTARARVKSTIRSTTATRRAGKGGCQCVGTDRLTERVSQAMTDEVLRARFGVGKAVDLITAYLDEEKADVLAVTAMTPPPPPAAAVVIAEPIGAIPFNKSATDEVVAPASDTTTTDDEWDVLEKSD